MKESIASRVARIISGSIHQLISAFENTATDAVMEKAILEIDDVIIDVRAELGKNAANKYMASKRLSDANEQHKDLSAKIELAIREKRDDLAEAAISRQLDIEAQIPVLESTISQLTKKEKELEGFISALQAKKREMKDDLRQFRLTRTESSVSADPPNDGDTSNLEIHSRVTRAESAFDRVLEKQTQIPGMPADLKTSAQLMELENLSRKNRIQERLAAKKTEINLLEKI